MRRTVLVAVPHGWETTLVDTLAGCPDLELVRRCADLPELLSTAAAGLGMVAFVGTGLGGFDLTAVAELRHHGLEVVGVARPGDEHDERQLRRLGIRVIVQADVDAAGITAALDHDIVADELSAALGLDSTPTGPGQPPAADVPERSGTQPLADDHNNAPDPVPAADQDEIPDREPGNIIVVWGPAGSPGRSSLALALVSEAAELGRSALLIDADPYGGTQAQALGLLDEAPGLAGALRSADQGALDVVSLGERCLAVAPRLSVLTGISRADRWPELRADPLESLLDISRLLADVIVVDCGFNLEDDEELSYDTLAPRRNAATLTALACADHLVVVGAGEPVGLQRLLRGLQELGTVRTPARRTVVVNRLRASAVGPRPQETVAAALGRFAAVDEVRFVPDDRDSFDRALLEGRTLLECAPQSPARRALIELTRHVLGLPDTDDAPTSRRHRSARRRRRR